MSLHSARNPLHPFPMPLTSLLLGNNILKLTWHLPVQFCIVFYLGMYSFTIYRTILCIKHFYMGNLTLYTLCPWNSPGKNTGVGNRFLLQGIFPNQGSNPGLALQADSLPSEPSGKRYVVHSIWQFALFNGIMALKCAQEAPVHSMELLCGISWCENVTVSIHSPLGEHLDYF